MQQDAHPILIGLSIQLLLTLPCLFIVWKKRWLRPSALNKTPPRQTAIRPWDALVGFAILSLGIALLALILPRLGLLLSPLQADENHLPTHKLAVQVLLYQLFAQLPIALYLLLRVSSRNSGQQQIGFLPFRPLKHTIVSIFALAVSIPPVLALISITALLGILLNQPMPQVGHELLNAINQSAFSPATFSLILSAILFAPFLEELIFRGLLQTALLAVPGMQHRRRLVVTATASLFAAVHVNSIAWQTLPGLLLLGLVLGWLYERTGSLWPPILTHVGFNAFNVIMVLWLSPAQP